jgi:hypothetical protein
MDSTPQEFENKSPEKLRDSNRGIFGNPNHQLLQGPMRVYQQIQKTQEGAWTKQEME